VVGWALLILSFLLILAFPWLHLLFVAAARESTTRAERCGNEWRSRWIEGLVMKLKVKRLPWSQNDDPLEWW
jgi:hypothetical protein